MITVSLRMVEPFGPCNPGWTGYLQAAGKTEVDDVQVPLSEVAQVTSLLSAMYCARALPEHEDTWRSFMLWCASRLDQCTKDRALKYALKARACAKQENWYEAACLVPNLAATAVGWHAFQNNQDFNQAKSQEEAAQLEYFTTIVS